MPDYWIGCLQLSTDLPVWALSRPWAASSRNDGLGDTQEAKDPFIVVENGEVVGRSATPYRKDVEVGMRKRRAQTLCPEASVFLRDPALERAAWDQALREVNKISPRVEPQRPGLAWFEPVEGSGLRTWLRQQPFQCGIGRRRLVARLAAWKATEGRLLCIKEKHEGGFLDRISVDALSDLGFEDDLAEQLKLFGYSSVGQASTLSEHHLTVQFGEQGEHLARVLHEGSERVSFYSSPPTIEAERTFEHPVEEPGPLETAIAEASKHIAGDLQGKAFQRVQLELRGRSSDVSTSRVVEPRTEAAQLERVGCALLDHVLEEGMRICALHLAVGSFQEHTGEQCHLFQAKRDRRQAVAAMERRHPGELLRVVSDRHAVFENERFTYEQVSSEGR